MKTLELRRTGPGAGESHLPLRERKKQRTRQLIVQTALQLFTRRGYTATTVNDIAAACELAPSTVFTYFPTKDAIVFAGTAASFAAFRTALEQRPRGVSTGRALRDWLEIRLTTGFDMDAGARNAWRKVINGDEDLRVQARHRLGQFEALLAPAIADDLGDPPDSPRVAMVAGAVGGAIAGTVANADASGGLGDKAAVDAVLDHFVALTEAVYRTVPPPKRAVGARRAASQTRA